LHMEPGSDIQIPALDTTALLDKRFYMAKDGSLLMDQPFSDSTGDKAITFVELWDRLKQSEAYTELISRLAGTDVRLMLKLVRRVIFSSHLNSLKRVSDMPYAIRALMLSENGEFVPDHSLIPNLFDNQTPERDGNSIVRGRVLEYLRMLGMITYRRNPALASFQRLGYDKGLIRGVLQLFVERKLVRAAEGHQIEKVDQADRLQVTELGKYLWDKVSLMSPYLDAIRRGMYIYESCTTERIRTDDGLAVKQRTISDDNLLKCLALEEMRENILARDYDKKHGESTKIFRASSMHDRVTAVLKGRPEIVK